MSGLYKRPFVYIPSENICVRVYKLSLVFAIVYCFAVTFIDIIIVLFIQVSLSYGFGSC